MNFGSYNYLGFAESVGPCADLAEEATKEYGVAVGSTRRELGKLTGRLIYFKKIPTVYSHVSL